LAPETLRAIVDIVLAAVREDMAHDQRVMRERTCGPEAGGEHR
jgi:hypothetical protein